MTTTTMNPDLARLNALQLPAGPVPANADDAVSAASDTAITGTYDREQYRAEVNHYVKTGRKGAMMRRFTLTSGSAGGLVPREIAPPVVLETGNAFRDAYRIYGLEPLETEKSHDAIAVPVLNADAGGIVAEDSTTDQLANEDADESLDLRTRTFTSGTLWASNTLIAALTDFTATFLPELVYLKERGLAAAIAAAIVADATITQEVVIGSTSALTYDNLTGLNQALPDKYNAFKAIVLSTAAYAAAENLKDTTGAAVMKRDPTRRGLEINGTPILRTSGFEAFGASKTIGAVFSLLGFRIRDTRRRNLTRFENIPTHPDQTGLNLFDYHGYDWAPSAVAKLRTPAA